MDRIPGILSFMHKIEKLKIHTRHCFTSAGKAESIAEHSWRLAVLASILEGELPEINMARVIEMCLVHDIGELETGDIPAFRKRKEDEAAEKGAIEAAARSLPENTKDKILGLWREYHECKTPEAKLANALDKMEAVLQHNEADIRTWSENEHSLNITYGEEAAEFNGFVKELRKAIRKETEEKISGKP